MKSKKLFLVFFFHRILFGLILNRTWFVADEYWQSQEVAHYLAFDYGYLTWEWKVGIRSFFYPLFLSVFYKLLELVNLDQTALIIYISPIIHCLLTALSDVALFSYCKKHHGSKIANLTLFLRLTSWFSNYMSSRSLTNNLEEIFTLFCLNALDTKENVINNYWIFHLLAFVSFIIRSTAAINLIPIYIYQFLNCKNQLKFLGQFIVIGVSVLTINLAIDSFFYNKFIVTWWNFFLFNVYQNIGDHYGVHKWYWYLSEGVPILLFTYLIPFLIGLYCLAKLDSVNQSIRYSFLTVCFNIFVYSLLAHKEFRFLSQIMPHLLLISAYGLKYLKLILKNQKLLMNIFVGMISIANMVLFLYVGLVHQRAPISLMNSLRNRVNSKNSSSILFLTPCHSTPFHSYLHNKNVTMRFLTCEPPLNLNQSERNVYLDEADHFYSNPLQWFKQNIQESHQRYAFIVLYKNLYENMNNLFENLKYSVCETFFNTHIIQSSKVDTHMLLLCLNN